MSSHLSDKSQVSEEFRSNAREHDGMKIVKGWGCVNSMAPYQAARQPGNRDVSGEPDRDPEETPEIPLDEPPPPPVEDPPSEPEERGPYVVGSYPDVVIRNTSGQKDEKRRSHRDYWRTQGAPRIRLDVAREAARNREQGWSRRA
jgi:hypothetical protein